MTKPLPSTFLNQIIAAASVGMPQQMPGEPHRCFGLFDDAICFIGESKKIFEESVNKLHGFEKDVYETTSRKWFIDRIMEIVTPRILEGSTLTNAEGSEAIDALSRVPNSKFHLFREIKGISFSPKSDPLRLGVFTIYSVVNHHHILQMRSSVSLQQALDHECPEFLIEVCTYAREPIKALELADIAFGGFEQVLRFMIGQRTEVYEVGILNYTGRNLLRAWQIEDKIINYNSAVKGTHETVSIDEPYFVSVEKGFDKLWALLAEPSPTPIQRRILMAVSWFSQSLYEKNLSSAFIKAAVAIELLFKSDKKAIITPSIMSQICEGTCLLLFDGVEERIHAEKRLKDAYGLRSAIVHSGSERVDHDSYRYIMMISRMLIITLLTDPRLASFSRLEEIGDYIKRVKYSGKAI